MAGATRTSMYDDFVAEYGAYTEWREQSGSERDPFGLLEQLLAVLGEVRGQSVLDAGCGEGYLSRILAGRGARVTGVDLGPRLVERSRQRDPDGAVEYRVADLCDPQPDLEGRFDAVASFFVLNDVEEHQGFAMTLGRALRSGGRAVLAFNNPYYYVLNKGGGAAYFQSGTAYPCGLVTRGIRVSFYHRTLPEYLEAFLAAGLTLTRIVDVDHPNVAAKRAAGESLPGIEGIPRFMVLAFAKP